MKKYFLGLTTGIILMVGVSVFAANLILGSEVSYDNSKTGLNSDNVNDAIDELYTMMDSNCPSGYKCIEINNCDYEEGYAWDFVYKGSIDTFKVPCDGLYKLEVWGSQGKEAAYDGQGSKNGVGGKGGYSSGYKKFNSGDDLFVVVGGTPYNGGGGSGSNWAGGCGGGATHIATRTGLLSTLSSYNSDIVIVAGGGGGGGYNSEGGNTGGAGGGLTGGVGGYRANQGTNCGGTGATQTSGGTVPSGSNGGSSGSFGKGGVNSTSIVGGGGGYYGGSSGIYGNGGTGGGGGSGYIGGVPEITYNGIIYTPTTTAGLNSGTGKARITLVAR